MGSRCLLAGLLVTQNTGRASGLIEVLVAFSVVTKGIVGLSGNQYIAALIWVELFFLPK